ncbi:MAG: hypothetical protein AAB672_00560 [Patescibacteria group bacterium]
MNRSLGLPRAPGSCFGVSDPRYLRPNFNRSPLPLPQATNKNKATITTRFYILEWWKKNFEPEHRSFRAKNNGLAVIKAMRILGIKGKLTGHKLRKAGASRVSLLSFSDGEIFPGPKQ